MGLTKRTIDAAIYIGTGNRRCVLWDDNPHGLGIRVFPSERKAFVLSYRVAGRKRLMCLGDYGVLTLEDARRRARNELLAVENDHSDPLTQRRTRAIEARTGDVESIFRAYVAAREADPHRPMKRPESVLWYGKKFVFQAFGSRSWREIRRSEVREWHAGIRSHYNADRALQALRSAFYWRLWQEDDAVGNRRRESDTRNPCAGIKLRKPDSRRDVRVEVEQFPALNRAISAETDDPYIRAYFRFVLSTGARKSEALRLEWCDVQSPRNGQPAQVKFRDTKNSTTHTIPLSTYAYALISKLPKVENNAYVFVGRVHGSHLKEPYKAWLRIRAAAGLDHVRIHDLRRTFGSWLGDAGFTSKQIGAALNHKSDITSRVYMALGDRSKRKAIDAVGALLVRAARSKPNRKARALLGAKSEKQYSGAKNEKIIAPASDSGVPLASA